MHTHNRKGDVSAYGLSCGIPQIVERATESGALWQFVLSHNGTTYDVHAGPIGASHDWAQFPRVSEARSFLRRILSKGDTGLVSGAFLTNAFRDAH